jgi:phage tail-like protein
MPFDQRVGVDDMLVGDFLVEIDGIAKTSFRKLSGGKKEYGEVTARDGNDPQRYRKQHGIMTIEDIALVEGRTSVASELEAWFEDKSRKDSLSIVQLDHNGNEVERHNCFNCLCKSIELFNGDATTDEAQVKTFVISVEDWEKA